MALKKERKCSWGRCTATRAFVRLSDDEAYCKRHAVWKADEVCRAFILARDETCIKCRKPEPLQWAHLHTRGMRYIRWDADNGVTLCQGCHFAYTKSPANWIMFLEERFPGRFTELTRANTALVRAGGHVDIAQVIETYRRGEPWYAERAEAA